MGLIKKLSHLIVPTRTTDAAAYWIAVRCRRCGEIIRARINLHNDLSVEYGDGGTTYICRKTLIGEGHCFQRVEVSLTFDANRKLVSYEITGGEFVDE
jgi:hypothetical protein